MIYYRDGTGKFVSKKTWEGRRAAQLWLQEVQWVNQTLDEFNLRRQHEDQLERRLVLDIVHIRAKHSEYFGNDSEFADFVYKSLESQGHLRIKL